MRTIAILLVLGIALGAVTLFAPAASADTCLPDGTTCARQVVCDVFFNGCGPCWPECADP
jgi:hypothetical protein